MLKGLGGLNVLNKDAHLVFTFMALKCSAQTIKKGFVYLTFLWGMDYRKGKTCQILKVFPYKLRAIFSFLM